MVFVTMWVQSFFSYHRKEHGTPLRVCPAVTLLRTGGKDLRLSAAYPKDYGREVARLHVEAMASWINKFVGNWREPFHLYLGLILVTGLMYRNKNWLISLTKSYENIMVWYSISQEASSGYLAPVLLSPEADGLQNLDLHGIVQGGFKEPLDSSEKEFMPDLVVIHGEVTMYICIWSTWNQLILPKKKACIACHKSIKNLAAKPSAGITSRVQLGPWWFWQPLRAGILCWSTWWTPTRSRCASPDCLLPSRFWTTAGPFGGTMTGGNIYRSNPIESPVVWQFQTFNIFPIFLYVICPWMGWFSDETFQGITLYEIKRCNGNWISFTQILRTYVE